MDRIYINGEFFDKDKAAVSVFDHGFLYGDGVFEGLRIYGGRIFKLREHLERLYEGAKMVYMTIPLTIDQMEQAVIDTCKENAMNGKDGYIRLVVSRGEGDLGISFQSCLNPNVVIIASSISVYPKETYLKGATLMTSSIRVKSHDHLFPMVKSLNYLGHIMARQEALINGYSEALLLNERGFVAEAAVENIFMIKGKNIYTPPVSDGILNGITRQTLINEILPNLGFSVSEKSITVFDLKGADEVFMSGTAVELMGIASIDKINIGCGQSGEQTLKIQEEFNTYAKSSGSII